MKNYQVLVVDDDARFCKLAQKLDGRHNCCIHVAGSLRDARSIFRKQFLHAAFVDLRLDPRRDDNRDGDTVLKELALARPACRLFLMTQYVSEQKDPIFKLLRPGSALVHGVFYKNEMEQEFEGTIRRLAEDWASGAITVQWEFDILDKLRKKISDAKAEITQEEIDYLVSSVLGQEHYRQEAMPEDVQAASLSELAGGRSRAIVAKGRPILGTGQECIWTVIKIGPRKEADEERRRYNRHVKWTLSANKRVELLAHKDGDTLGAVCYSFAHQSPKNVSTLERMVVEKNPELLPRLRSVFTSEREWYKNPVESLQGQGSFFLNEHDLRPDAVLDRMQEFLHEKALDFGLRWNGSTMVKDAGTELGVHKTIIGGGRIRQPFLSCIVHGDLNFGNILIAADDPTDDRWAFIDYAHTGPGPASMDFAVLQTQLRLISAESIEIDIVESLKMDEDCWRQGWFDPAAAQRENTNPQSFEADVSHELFRLARQNFPSLDASEHALTCILWTLRIFKIKALSNKQRMRLVIWLNSNFKIINEEERLGILPDKDRGTAYNRI